MALKRLRIGEMVQISSSWVTAGSPAREAILAIPELAGLLPRVEAAHKALHETQPAADAPSIVKIQERASGYDARHDDIVRGGYWLCAALAWLSGNAEAAERWLRLRDQLFPAGLDTAQKPYREEAGAADLLKSRLKAEPALRKQLKEIPVLGKNLGVFIDELIDVAKKLGDVEDERARALLSSGPAEPAMVQAARFKWIRAVNALVANGELAELSGEQDAVIFGALRHADRLSDRRKAAPAEEPAEPTPTEPAAPPAAPAGPTH